MFEEFLRFILPQRCWTAINSTETKYRHEEALALCKDTGPLDSAGRLWVGQWYGLLLLILMSFFPRLFHMEEYLFFGFLLIAIVTTAVQWRRGNSISVRTPIDLPLCMVIAWILFSIPFAIDPAYSFSEWRKLIVQVLVFYWTVGVLRSSLDIAKLWNVLGVIVVATLILCSYALIDFVLQGGSFHDRDVRARAPYSDYNWLSTYLVLATPLLIVCLVTTQTHWRRYLTLFVASLALFGHLFSYTRAGWAAVLAQGLFGVLANKHRGLLLMLVVAVGCIVLAGLMLPMLGYQQQTASLNTLQYRLAVWKLSIKELASHPIFGIGYGSGTFNMRFADYPELHDAKGVHNMFLMIALGSGIPALMFLLWTIGRALKAIMVVVHTMGESAVSVMLIGIGASIIGFFVRNLFDYMMIGSLGFLFWIVLGVGMVAISTSERSAAKATDFCSSDTSCA